MPEKPTPEDKLNEPIPCECGNENHKAGLIISKWGSLEEGIVEDKVKIQIFEDEEIKSVIIYKKKLLEKLK